jgi:hypothetical protein
MSTELTKEQRVTVRVCDEWLAEAGLPLYSDLVKLMEKPRAEVAEPVINIIGLV